MLVKSSVGFSGFQKLTFSVEIPKNLKNIKKHEKFVDEGDPALRVIRAGTMLAVYRVLPSLSQSSTKTIAKPARLGPAEHITITQKFIEITMLLHDRQ